MNLKFQSEISNPRDRLDPYRTIQFPVNSSVLWQVVEIETPAVRVTNSEPRITTRTHDG